MYRPSKPFEQEPWATLAWAMAVCLLAAGTFFLAYENGSYSISQRETLAALVWWTLAIGTLLGILPRATPAASAWATGVLVAVFGVFTAASAFWANSAEKAFEEGDRVWLLAGIYLLVVFLSPPGSALFWVRGLGLGVTAVGALALVSRLWPHLFSQTAQTAALFPSAAKRLSFPVGYWNGLATLIALGVPLLLALAVAERRPIARGLALAPVPALVGVVYLTSSRGGSLALVLATLLFLVLAGRFLSACGATLVGVAGAAGVVAVLHARPELVNTPLESAIAESQGRSAALWIGLICLGTGALYGALTAFGPEAPPLPRALGWIAGVVFVIVAALAIAAAHPGKRFEEFKAVPSDLGSESIQQHLLSSTSNGRWQLWQVAADEFRDHPAVGGGAGSYEAEWAEHGTLKLFVRDAHSLYIETLGELGIVGLALLLSRARGRSRHGTQAALLECRHRAPSPGRPDRRVRRFPFRGGLRLDVGADGRVRPRLRNTRSRNRARRRGARDRPARDEAGLVLPRSGLCRRNRLPRDRALPPAREPRGHAQPGRGGERGHP